MTTETKPGQNEILNLEANRVIEILKSRNITHVSGGMAFLNKELMAKAGDDLVSEAVKISDPSVEERITEDMQREGFTTAEQWIEYLDKNSSK